MPPNRSYPVWHQESHSRSTASVSVLLPWNGHLPGTTKPNSIATRQASLDQHRTISLGSHHAERFVGTNFHRTKDQGPSHEHNSRSTSRIHRYSSKQITSTSLAHLISARVIAFGLCLATAWTEDMFESRQGEHVLGLWAWSSWLSVLHLRRL